MTKNKTIEDFFKTLNKKYLDKNFQLRIYGKIYSINDYKKILVASKISKITEKKTKNESNIYKVITQNGDKYNITVDKKILLIYLIESKSNESKNQMNGTMNKAMNGGGYSYYPNMPTIGGKIQFRGYLSSSRPQTNPNENFGLSLSQQIGGKMNVSSYYLEKDKPYLLTYFDKK